MNIEELRDLALSFPMVEEDIKWETTLTFTIKEKIFLFTGVDTIPCSMSVKVPKEDFPEIGAQDGFMQAPYLAKGQWVKVMDIEDLSYEDAKHYVEQSFRLIVEKLPKYVQKEIEL